MDAGEETRDEAGRFLPGKSGNPEGTARPWQPFGVRCQHWLSKMTRKELRELATNEEEMDKLSSYDSMVITALVAAQTGKEKGRERERVLNRIEGPPAQIIKLGGEEHGEAIKIADATRTVYGLLGVVAARKQSGGTEADCMAETGEAGTDNTQG